MGVPGTPLSHKPVPAVRAKQPPPHTVEESRPYKYSQPHGNESQTHQPKEHGHRAELPAVPWIVVLFNLDSKNHPQYARGSEQVVLLLGIADHGPEHHHDNRPQEQERAENGRRRTRANRDSAQTATVPEKPSGCPARSGRRRTSPADGGVDEPSSCGSWRPDARHHDFPPQADNLVCRTMDTALGVALPTSVEHAYHKYTSRCLPGQISTGAPPRYPSVLFPRCTCDVNSPLNLGPLGTGCRFPEPE